MFRPPSAAQLASENANLLPKALPSTSSAHDPTSTRFFSNTTTTALNKEDQDFNIDELFLKHTVSEIRVIQSRLGMEADDKKEELRQMVGERYRDLLQASSSIISIASSSSRVVESLDESMLAIRSQADPPLPRASSVASVQDRHLHVLQVLAAHIKLLLDVPEHLWRLIERKKFFPAAWLFLLARVIHRALVRSDEQDDEAWKSQGIDVLAEFPLIQRQWDVVSQFRSQIIQKATLSLRDASRSVEDTCATLITLHLLDSRPLRDTLTSMLSQRSKTLDLALAAKSQTGSSSSSSLFVSRQPANGKILPSFSQDTSTSSLAKPRIREVKESLDNALTIISQTMNAARGVFGDISGRALIEHVLEYIQSDADKNVSIPAELHLTTQTLLTNVTSATHFQLLPQNLQSYKPYVDLTSSSTLLRREQFLVQLNDWFLLSNKQFQSATERWLQELETVREIWSVRVASKKWIGMSTLEEGEKLCILAVVDEKCRERIVEIWTSMLKAASTAFETTLDISMRTIESNEADINNSPIEFLFNTVALPPLSQSSNHDIPLRIYQNSLKHQLLGRTVLFDSVLDSLERCSRHIHEEISLIRVGLRTEPKSIINLLMQQHESAAERLTESSFLVLQKAVDQTEGDDDKSVRKLVFLGQITEELALRSSFIDRIGCGQTASDAFVDQLNILNNTIMETWKQRIVARIFRRSLPTSRVIPTPMEGPTPELLHMLVEMYEALQILTFKWDNAKQRSFMYATLKLFIEKWLQERVGHESATAHDLALLRELIKPAEAQAKSLDTLQNLGDRLGELIDSSKVETGSAEYVKRMQTFLSATVECQPDEGRSPNEGMDKFPNLLRYGPPTELQASLDFTKPGPRLGLLQVAEDTAW